MPYSAAEGKPWVVEQYRRLKPRDVVDLGCGAGTYARLLRPVRRSDWTGVEIHAPYIDRFDLRNVYDRVIQCDVLAFCRFLDGVNPNSTPMYGLIIAGDLIEHLPPDDGVTLVTAMRRHARAALVAAPIIEWPQGAIDGNPHEAHLTHYTADTLRDLVQPTTEWVGEQVGYFLWERP